MITMETVTESEIHFYRGGRLLFWARTYGSRWELCEPDGSHIDTFTDTDEMADFIEDEEGDEVLDA